MLANLDRFEQLLGYNSTKKECDAVLDAPIPMNSMLHYEEGGGVPGSHILTLHAALHQEICGLSGAALARFVGDNEEKSIKTLVEER